MSMYEDGNPAQDASKDSLHALRVKSLALLERSSRLAMVPEAGESQDCVPMPLIDWALVAERTPTFWHEFNATDVALTRIAQTLPHIHSGMGINDTSSLIFVHTFVHGSTIQLHSPFLDTHPASYERVCPASSLCCCRVELKLRRQCVQAAEAAMEVVYLIDNIDAKNFHMLMGVSFLRVGYIS